MIDPWGESYVVRENQSKEKKQDWMHNRDGVDIYSTGPNMEDDTYDPIEDSESDDIGNWQ